MSLLPAKIAFARALGGLARRTGHGGNSLPGKVLLRLQPDAIQQLAGRLPRGSIVLSATNGKTTTAAMVATILERAGIGLVHNRAGANMGGGVASALAAAARGQGDMAGELGLFELDEFWLDRLSGPLSPRAVLLGNLFRDQLDRYGELEAVAERWRSVVSGLGPAVALALNADDPLVADLGRDRAGVAYFGVEDPAMAVPEMQHAADSKHCRRCGAAYEFDAIFLGHLGHYHCPNCGQRRPEPEVSAREIVLDGTRTATFSLSAPGDQVTVRLPLPGLYNVYNALGAATLCLKLGIPLPDVASGLEAVAPVFGRAEKVMVGSRELQILLVKNPAGANEILRTLALEDGDLDLLAILNDRIADGRDVSWIWDADFELLAGRARRVICGGTRASELALRLKYAGTPVERLEVVSGVAAALDRALAEPDGDGRLFVLPTYTALLELQAELAHGGHVGRYWEARR